MNIISDADSGINLKTPEELIHLAQVLKNDGWEADDIQQFLEDEGVDGATALLAVLYLK